MNRGSDPKIPPNVAEADRAADLGFDLILASASPRRRELLERLGLMLELAPVDVDETPQPGEKAGRLRAPPRRRQCDAAVAALPAPRRARGGDRCSAPTRS